MAIANTVKTYLDKSGIQYSVVAHPHTWSSKETADLAHIPAEQLAKAVVLIDDVGYVMAVVPSNRHVSVHSLSQKLKRELTLAPEHRIAPVFKDCDLGAVPPLGAAYGMETVLDDSLVGLPEVYFEAGDHEELIRVDGEAFVRLLKEARHGQFSH